MKKQNFYTIFILIFSWLFCSQVQGMAVAARHGKTEKVRELLKAGVSANRFPNGWSPLHEACHHGHYEIAQLLLAHGALPDVRDDYQKAPLHIACTQSGYSMALLLIEHGADVNVQDSRGDTPLHRVAASGWEGMAHLFLLHGAKVCLENREGKTADQLAQAAGMRWLFENWKRKLKIKNTRRILSSKHNREVGFKNLSDEVIGLIIDGVEKLSLSE